RVDGCPPRECPPWGGGDPPVGRRDPGAGATPGFARAPPGGGAAIPGGGPAGRSTPGARCSIPYDRLSGIVGLPALAGPRGVPYDGASNPRDRGIAYGWLSGRVLCSTPGLAEESGGRRMYGLARYIALSSNRGL